MQVSLSTKSITRRTRRRCRWNSSSCIIPVRRRWTELERLAGELNQAEDEAGLPLTRRPDAGFFAPAYSWAAGDDLGEVIAGDEMSGGDFVRNVKQIIDLLRQIRTVALEPATAAGA